MKRFLYYNQDSVNSLLAQMGKGLLLKRESGSEESKSTSITDEIRPSLTGDLGAKVLGVGVSLKGELQASSSNEDITNTMIHRVQEIVLHDYAFEKVLGHIYDNSLLNNDAPNIGDYVLIEDTPTFLDFDFFESLYAENGLNQFMNDQKRTQVKKLKDAMSKGAKVSPEIKQQIKDMEGEISSSEAERKQMLKNIAMIKNTLPYKRFILTNNLFVPLDDTNLRDDPSIIAFKYGGKIKIFGYITNVITKESNKKVSKNDFSAAFDLINKAMLSISKASSILYIVHPVALYY